MDRKFYIGDCLAVAILAFCIDSLLYAKLIVFMCALVWAHNASGPTKTTTTMMMKTERMESLLRQNTHWDSLFIYILSPMFLQWECKFAAYQWFSNFLYIWEKVTFHWLVFAFVCQFVGRLVGCFAIPSTCLNLLEMSYFSHAIGASHSHSCSYILVSVCSISTLR